MSVLQSMFCMQIIKLVCGVYTLETAQGRQLYSLKIHETFLRFIIKLKGIFLWMMGHLKETVNI